MTDQEREAIRQMIQDSVTNAMGSRCLCDLSADQRAEMGHLIGAFRDLGAGNLSIGITEMGKAISWLMRVRQFGATVGGRVAVYFVLAAAGGAVVLLTMGIRAWVDK